METIGGSASMAMRTLASALFPASSAACAVKLCAPSPVTSGSQSTAAPSSSHVKVASPLLVSLAAAPASYESARHQPGVPGVAQSVEIVTSGATESTLTAGTWTLPAFPASSVIATECASAEPSAAVKASGQVKPDVSASQSKTTSGALVNQPWRPRVPPTRLAFAAGATLSTFTAGTWTTAEFPAVSLTVISLAAEIPSAAT